MILVRLLKPAKQQVVEFPAVLLRQTAGEIVVQAEWTRPTLDLGYVVFAPGDRFVEHYYTDRYYTVYVIRTPDGRLKGYYCNIARPAMFDGGVLTSEDLELDLFVSPDRQTLLTLDQGEFDARGFAQHDPATHAAALSALEELKRRAVEGIEPFHHKGTENTPA